MTQVRPPRMSRVEAHLGIVHHMLTLRGNQRATETVLINRQPYRITVERLATNEMAEALARPLQEIPDANPSVGASQRRD